MAERDECDAECVDGFSANMWGVWDAESCGGQAPKAIFSREDLASAFVDWVQSEAAGEHQTNVDLCVLPVCVADAVVHNCHVGNDGVFIDAAAAWKIEKKS